MTRYIVFFTYLLILAIGCTKKSDDPKPSTTSTNPTSIDTTTTLKFTATEATIVGGSGDSVKIDLTPYVTGSNKDSITVKTVTGALNTQIQNIRGKAFTVVPNNKVFSGTEKYTITITDGKNSTTSTFTIKVGTIDQANTYALFEKYAFGKTLQGDVGNFKLSTDGTLKSGVNSAFYDGGSNSATYTILNNGYIRLKISSVTTIDYKVTERVVGSGGLTFFDNIDNQSFIEY